MTRKKKTEIEQETMEEAVFQYYRLDRIQKKHAKYNLVIGERSSGKTFAALEYCLKNYCEGKGTFAYIRRWEEDTRGKRGASLFDGITANKLVEKYTKGEYNCVQYWSQRFYLCKYDPEKGTKITAPEPFGYCFAISTMQHDKSSSYPSITTVVFDEFLTRGTYIVDEFVEFMNTLSTIIRDRDNVTIYMLANTVNKYCPYFIEMGLSHVKYQEPGSIDVYEYGETGLRVAVEYTGDVIVEGEEVRVTVPKLKKKKNSDVYFAFNNPKLNMITTGAWELDIYPHCPVKYKPKNIRYTYFITFDDQIFQCEIIRVEKAVFTFVHRRTYPIPPDTRQLVFSTEYDVRYNYRIRIDRPFDDISKTIWSHFQKYMVYYQDNEVGDMIQNYLNWCVEQ